jgi:predicted Zn-dependent peptidase
MACGVLNDRLQVRLREALGATYSPTVGLEYRMGDRIFATVGVAVAPGNEQAVLKECLGELDRLVSVAVTAEEIDRLRPSFEGAILRFRESNTGWASALATAHLRPDGLDRIKNAQAALAAVSADDVSAMAARCLRADASSTLILRAANAK